MAMKKLFMLLIAAAAAVCMLSATALAAGDARLQSMAVLYITSSDPENRGREWVEAAADKSNKAAGSLLMLSADGEIIYEGDLKQIKGRGNSTWTYAKKPYQLKLAAAADLCETGIESEKAVTWVLLANYKDKTLLRNQYTFALAEKLGLSYTPHCRQVSLYYDGEYRGVYLLCEKTEAGEGRVEIETLDTAIEEANPGVKLSDAETVVTETASGLICRAAAALKMPEKDGGYLLELDYASRAKAEKSWFATSRGQYVAVKSPEILPMEGMEYIASLYNSFEAAVYNGGTDPETGLLYSDIVDVESLALMYLIEELSQDTDAFGSSFYFYKPEGEDKLYAGPVWDFDVGYGYCFDNSEIMSSEGFGAGQTELGKQLLQIPSFREKLCELYEAVFYKAVTETAEEIPQWSELYSEEICRNSELWPDNTQGDAAEAQEELKKFILSRNDYLKEHILKWSSEEVTAPDPGFFDVFSSDACHDAVLCVAEAGIMEGTGPGIFAPEKEMNRAMAITVIYRLAGLPESDGKCSFSDVTEGMWYAKPIAWAEKNNITNGIGNGKFGLNRIITLQDFITLLYRCFGSETETDGAAFESEAMIADYALDAFAWAESVGCLNTEKLAELAPSSALSRGNCAVIISCLLRNLENTEK